MSKVYYYGVAAIAILGLLASILISPNANEIALMNLEDKHFDDAFSKYKKLLDEGDNSINVVIPLSKLYLQFGDVGSAVTLMEQFVEKNPD